VTDLRAAVDRVWPGASPRFEVLGGGITNLNVKVELGGESYVLRIAGRDTELLGIDRRVELEATRAAAALGIGPEVARFVEPEGWLVTRFIAGESLPPPRMAEPANLERVADALRAVHAGPEISGSFDSFRVVERYLETATERGGEEPEAYAWAHGLARRIEAMRTGAPLCLCHNDLLNANFIDDSERMRIVDWEYAGMGDRFFDLANFAINHELGEPGRRRLLEAYFGAVREEDARALELMRFMSDLREAMWGILQTAVSSLDFDFAGYAKEHFERLARTAAEPAFEAALGS
jgi:thiamine kinase-like enzyme